METKIKKEKSEIVYLKQTESMVFDINGKKVSVLVMDGRDLDQYDFDYEINEKDLEALTEEEREYFEDCIHILLDLETGQEYEEDA